MTDLSELTTPDKILNAALSKEKEAHDFYEHMAANCKVDFVRELLESLQNEESKHMHLIKEMKRKLVSGHEIL